MRTLLIAGNWKMNKLLEEGLELIDQIRTGLDSVPQDRDLAIFPPYTLLHAAAGRLAGTRIWLGAQDVHWEDEGAFTSAVSGPMVRDIGCTQVLVGHSERREHFGDDGAILARKLRAALRHGLHPVYCMGERLEDREAGSTEAVLKAQFDEVLPGIDSQHLKRLALAYEPVWAIGTGRTATPDMAQEAHRFLRTLLEREYGEDVASRLRILYGGSVKPDNAATLLSQPDVDGALIGGACLAAESFLGIARAAI
jgi:triosephosphate isomerase (TIM)